LLDAARLQSGGRFAAGLLEAGQRQHGCYYRAGAAQELNAALGQAGWKPLLPEAGARRRRAAQGSRSGRAMGRRRLVPGAAGQAVGAQAASRALALQLVQLVSADADTHEIEALLRQDPTLSYHLLKLVNSLGMGTGRRVTSFSQAILILGRSQLRRWLNLMLFSSREGDPRSAMLLSRVAVRARSMELLSKALGEDKHHQEQAFMVGMFSLLGVLFGMPLEEVLKPLTISESVQQACCRTTGKWASCCVSWNRPSARITMRWPAAWRRCRSNCRL
jgi:EAL and modified HD-GYP domain-containing signal transduction protein